MFKWLFGGTNSNQLDERKEPSFEPSPRIDNRAGSASSAKGDGQLAIEGGEIVRKFMMAGYEDERGIHLETILSATAALAGYGAQQAALAMIRAGAPEAKQFPQFHEVTGKSGQVFMI